MRFSISRITSISAIAPEVGVLKLRSYSFDLSRWASPFTLNLLEKKRQFFLQWVTKSKDEKETTGFRTYTNIYSLASQKSTELLNQALTVSHQVPNTYKLKRKNPKFYGESNVYSWPMNIKSISKSDLFLRLGWLDILRSPDDVHWYGLLRVCAAIRSPQICFPKFPWQHDLSHSSWHKMTISSRLLIRKSEKISHTWFRNQNDIHTHKGKKILPELDYLQHEPV